MLQGKEYAGYENFNEFVLQSNGSLIWKSLAFIVSGPRRGPEQQIRIYCQKSVPSSQIAELLVAVKGRERPTIPSLHGQRLHLGSIYKMLCNELRRIGEHQNIQD